MAIKIIENTGNQFDIYEVPVYADCVDVFHQSFDFIKAHNYDDLVMGNFSACIV